MLLILIASAFRIDRDRNDVPSKRDARDHAAHTPVVARMDRTRLNVKLDRILSTRRTRTAPEAFQLCARTSDQTGYHGCSMIHQKDPPFPSFLIRPTHALPLIRWKRAGRMIRAVHVMTIMTSLVTEACWCTSTGEREGRPRVDGVSAMFRVHRQSSIVNRQSSVVLSEQGDQRAGERGVGRRGRDDRLATCGSFFSPFYSYRMGGFRSFA
jgi:hypothetical protein